MFSLGSQLLAITTFSMDNYDLGDFSVGEFRLLLAAVARVVVERIVWTVLTGTLIDLPRV